MKKDRTILSIIVLLAGTILTASVFQHSEQQQDDAAPLNEHLKPLKPFLGKTWKGKFVDPNTKKQVYDVSRWERALNGQAVRIRHSLNDGEYGGETIIIWDPKKESLVFFYFTTAGFYTNGTMTVEEGKMTSHEIVTGNQNGITEVKAVGILLPDGRLHSKSQYLQNGEWVDGHEFFYVEDATARVIFK